MYRQWNEFYREDANDDDDDVAERRISSSIIDCDSTATLYGRSSEVIFFIAAARQCRRCHEDPAGRAAVGPWRDIQ